jgi:phytoene dehydrogenase-like protein
MESPDAVVVGAGPNGLAAALVLARAGLSVTLLEGAEEPGGGCRTAELTLPGFHHDVCSAAHPLAVASPFFRDLDLEAHGVRLLQPEVPFAHPLGGEHAGVAYRGVDETASAIGGGDGRAYRRLFEPLVASNETIARAVLSSYRSIPASPWRVAGFASFGMLPALRLASRFEGAEARALLGGVAAHAMRPLDRPLTGGVALLLGSLAHAVGWPVVEGGSANIVRALTTELRSFGVEVVTGRSIRSLSEVPPARATLLDVGPRQLLALAGNRLPSGYRRRLEAFRYGSGVCKVDWALDGPVPWSAAVCRTAGTLHLGGTFEEVANAEAEVAAGRHPELPYVLTVQPGVVDPTRAPDGKHTLWTYCHVPAGSDRDMSAAIAAQIERFAPGFGDLVLARSVRTARDMQGENPNYVGGSIDGGVQDLRQTIARPALRWDPYRTPLPGVYLCSASTPPGPGVHGRCGELAARSALRREFGIRYGAVGSPDRLAVSHEGSG